MKTDQCISGVAGLCSKDFLRKYLGKRRQDQANISEAEAMKKMVVIHCLPMA
jgi:hypothetical protein